MASDYPLEELGPRAFEQLTVALAMSVLGPGVEAFGAGPDGGREATYTGPVNWSATTDMGDDSWNGYVVVQAKQMEHPGAPNRNAAWLRGQIANEFDSWMKEDSRRGQFPRYMLFVTNARLSSVPGVGGIDAVDEYIRKRWTGEDYEYPKQNGLQFRGLRAWKVWHRDQLNALLTVNDGIRRAFPAMLTSGDLLHRLNSTTLTSPTHVHNVLTAHAGSALTQERWINFGEAGGDGTARQSIEAVMVDLPAVIAGTDLRRQALRTILERGDQVLRKSMTPTGKSRHIVLTGAPGNGKSTASKFLVQLYRTTFVLSESLPAGASEVKRDTLDAASRLRLPLPKNRRWPMRVDLTDLADDLGPTSDKSLLRWLSEKIMKRADQDIQPSTLLSWLRVWPWIIIFDGLDEVSSPEVRLRIIDEIKEFVDIADQQDADLFVIVTTRPTGYTERIAPRDFGQLDLDYLSAEAAVAYGRLVTSLRLDHDPDRRDLILTRFERAAKDAATERLLKTPLQVLIVTLLLDRLGTLPADRYQLFWRYFETVYEREAAKKTSFAALFAQHRSDITQLHERVGLVLQIHAETSGESRARLPFEQLRRLATNRLLEVGYDKSAVPRIAQQIVDAATKRLVLLVPAEDDTVAFEVRSLQELMAARALSAGSDTQLRTRLLVTAPSPHWRNTWVFFAGRLFSDGPDHRLDLVLDVMENIDGNTDWPGWLCPVGPELAGDILDDGLTATKPRWERRAVNVGLRALTGAPPRDIRGLAVGISAVGPHSQLMIHIRGAMKQAFGGTPQARAIACMLWIEGQFGTSAIPGLPADHAIHAEIWAGKISSRGRKTTVGDVLTPLLSELAEAADASSVEAVTDALTELKALELRHTAGDVGLWPILPAPTQTWPKTLAALQDPDARFLLELLCGDLPVDQWQAKELMARAVWPALSRAPVGDRLDLQYS